MLKYKNLHKIKTYSLLTIINHNLLKTQSTTTKRKGKHREQSTQRTEQGMVRKTKMRPHARKHLAWVDSSGLEGFHPQTVGEMDISSF